MKPDQWTWVPLDAVLALYDEQISEHGGVRGIRDRAVVDSSLARPLNLLAYGQNLGLQLLTTANFGLSESSATW